MSNQPIWGGRLGPRLFGKILMLKTSELFLSRVHGAATLITAKDD